MKISNRPSKGSAIKLYVIEEQEIYREAYRTVFNSNPMMELLGICGGEGMHQIGKRVSVSKPDVLLIGVKALRTGVVEELIKVRKENPGVGVILLVMNISIKDIGLVRGSLIDGSGGIAFFSKQSLDEIEQLCNIIASVFRGEVTLDRLVTAIFSGRSKCEDLKDLPPGNWKSSVCFLWDIPTWVLPRPFISM